MIINGCDCFHCYIIPTKRAPSSPLPNHFNCIACVLRLRLFSGYFWNPTDWNRESKEKKNSANDKNKFILI